ncbi:MAG: M20/M25/M40 family metallo-hydrolase [Deltaproteobacteria bacterium]|nr:M20/M25/M40 family metallo-hydrolase [Deltaproteobacteria bacterium]MBW2041181.1 M20/M25/M40 family metallo-hydrolase [Deltaproteobacteria bacterium]
MFQLDELMQNELIELTQAMIRIPSFTGEEKTLADFILAKLKEYKVDKAFIDGIGNVVGLVEGSRPGPTVILNGHLDIVPPGKIDNWNGYDPFGAEIDDKGNIHGRGASDLKGGLSVQLYLMKLFQYLKNNGKKLSGNLVFTAVVHEEAAEMFGAEYLFTKTLPEAQITCDVVFLSEPTGLNVVLGQRGKVEIVVKTYGRSAHSSRPEAGINALEKMVPILEYVFGSAASNFESHELLGRSSITITNLVCSPGILSILPDECEISIDRRYMPNQDVSELIDEFESLFSEIRKKDPQFDAVVYPRKIVEVSYTGYQKEVQKYHPPWITPFDHPFVKKTMTALTKIGQTPKIKYWQFGTDGSMTAATLGIPTIGYSGTEEKYAHTPEEQVNIKMMLKSLEGYFAIITEILGEDSGDTVKF